MDNSTMPPPDDLVSRAAFYFEESKPMIPLYIHLILSSLFPIVTGSFASLSRPSTAAKPSKKAKVEDGEEGEEDEDEVEQKMEGLSPRDAIVLPITAGAVLGGLYWLIKQYGADPINLILGWYFSGVGIFSVGKLLNDAAALVLTVVFPAYFAHKGKLYKVDGTNRKAVIHGAREGNRASPLPGVLGILPLPTVVNNYLWALRSVPSQKYSFVTYIKGVLDVEGPVTLVNVAAGVCSLAAISYNHFVDKPWWLTNLQGFAVSYTALQVMSPTSFTTGSLILSGLFFYDIWAVFFTPLMVTVAKNLDQPIKLLFPRPDQPGAEGKPPVKSFSMLGLGDIVLPGLMIGLALRFDLHMYYLRKQKVKTQPEGKSKTEENVTKAEYHNVTGHWGSRIWTAGLNRSLLPEPLKTAAFSKPYFIASLVGYVLGMIATLGVMSVFQHAQPALLYLVPGVLISIWSTGLARGEVKQMWNYTEDVSGEAAEDDADSKKKEEGDKAKSDSKDGEKPAESWWDFFQYEVVGLSRPEQISDKKSDDTKDAEGESGVLKSKAAQDPDSIFAISIRRMSRSKKAQKDAATSTSDAGSQSSSDDAVLVSRNPEDSDSKGNVRNRIRGKNA